MTSSSSSAALRAASWSSSMAPSTACSASLLQGVWRPVKSDARSVDETAGDADVIPGWFLPVWVPEQGGRMVGNDNRDAPEPVDLIAQRAERLLRVEERLRRRPPHRENHLRFHDLDLAEQVRDAGRDLVELRLAVVGRPAFHDVTDEDPLARQLDGAKDFGEQLARGPYERTTGFVFHPPRSLAHDDEARVPRTLARHRGATTFAQPALGAARDQPRDRVERGCLRDGIVGKQVATGRVVGQTRRRKIGTTRRRPALRDSRGVTRGQPSRVDRW